MRIVKSSTGATSALILLVDDNKMGLAARRAVLEQLGHRVITAENGEDALLAVEANSFDLLITDWKMPKLDGIELIQQLRAASHYFPIVLLTGRTEAAWLREEKVGADAVVLKTASEVEVLLSTVTRLLSRKAARKPASSEGPGKNIKPKSKPG